MGGKKIVRTKRSQITIFIILGILILATTSLVFYIRQKASEYRPQHITKEEAKNIPQYMDACVNIIGKEGITKLELQGGYIYLPEEFLMDNKSIIPFGPFKVPHWYYQEQNRMPNKQYLESQLSQYLEEKLPNCLGNFDPFANQYNFEFPKNYSVKTTISDSLVQFELDYPLVVRDKLNDKPTSFDIFTTKVRTRLGKLFKLSKAIMDQENRPNFAQKHLPQGGNYLERISDDIIATSGLPYEGFEFYCGQKMWKKSEIKDEIFQRLKNNLLYLSFSVTDKSREDYQYSDFYENLYRIQLDTTEESFPGITVQTLMDQSWPGYKFDVTPSSGDIIKPIDPDMPLMNVCFKLYHHKWDIQYPIMFQLTDKYTGERLNFATMVVVKRNEPARTFSKNKFLVDQEFITITRQDFCDSASYPTRVLVRDSRRSKMPNDGFLENATVKYQCLRFGCELGKTSEETMDGVPLGGWPVLTTKLPFCQNGIISASLEGYVSEQMFVTTEREDVTQSYTLELTAKKSFEDLVFPIYEYENVESKNAASQRDLYADETVLVSIIYKNISYSQDIIYSLTQTGGEPLTLLLKPGAKFDIDVKLLSGQNVIGGYYRANLTLSVDALERYDQLTIPIIIQTTPPAQEQFDAYWKGFVLVKSQKQSIKIG